RHSALGWEACNENEHVGILLCALIIVQAEESPDVHQAILLRRHGAAVAVAEEFSCNVENRLAGKLRLSLFDEKAVLCETAGIEDEGNPVAVQQRTGTPDIVHRHRPPAPPLLWY